MNTYRISNTSYEDYYIKSDFNISKTISLMRGVAMEQQKRYEKEEIDYDDTNICSLVHSDPDSFQFEKVYDYTKEGDISLEECLTWV